MSQQLTELERGCWEKVSILTNRWCHSTPVLFSIKPLTHTEPFSCRFICLHYCGQIIDFHLGELLLSFIKDIKMLI